MEGMNSRNSKAHVRSKTEPLDLSPIPAVKQVAKMETSDFPKTEAVETFWKAETTDFPKIEKMEPIVKAEPFDLPKTEKMEPFGKTEPLDFPKIEKLQPFGKTEPLDSPQTEVPEQFDLSKAKTVRLFGQPLIGSTFGDEKRKNLLLKLSKVRDFIRLMLNYPMRTVHDSKLKAWTRDASNRRHSLEDLNRLLNQKPFKCFQGLLPMEILENVERGWTPTYADCYGIPEAILSFAVNLAVDQLVQTLLSEDDHVCNIHHVLLSTRDAAEKRLVMEKLESIFKDKENLVHLHETFVGVLLIDASVYLSQVEVHVRQQIAQQLQLPMLEGSDEWLITSIEKEMSRKKYLVLLVDGEAKEPLDPRKMGLPDEELAGVAVCITTESSKKAYGELTMAIDLNISTKDHLLPWEVFRRNLGLMSFQSSNAKRMAVRIVEECGSHLLAIVIVAKTIKRYNLELVLDKLCSLHPSYDISMFHGQSSVMSKAFINFIWQDLSKTQKCCLTSCLFISNIKFGKLENELINDWISSRFVVAGQAEYNLRELVDCFALLQFKDTKSRYIQIPEDTYAILQSLNAQNPLLMIKSGLGLVEPPKSELWHSVVHIELADNKLSELPLSPNCPNLKILTLHSNADLTKIPSLFFSKMPILSILDLSYTSVRELPNSFFEMEQLRELYMKGCERFMKLPSEVRKLKKLEKLDLDKTQIIHLPKEIQELSNLQSLTLYFYEYHGKKSMQYTNPTIVPSGVISKLKGLKHLSIDVNPNDERWQENVQIILPEILALECLQTISLYIPEPKLLNLIPAHIFEVDFRFVVGCHMSRIISGTPPTVEEKFKQSECSLKFVKGYGVSYEIVNAVRHSKALFFDRHMTIKDLSVFGIMNIEQLHVCILAECKEMQTIVDGRCSSRKDIFPHLLLLSASYMKNLRSICEGQVHSSNSFGMLKSLTLNNCPKLTTIFTLDFLGNLSILKVLVVKDCPKIVALISCGSSQFKTGTFLPNLRTMTLLHLPDLISISNEFHMGPSLENIGIYDCPKLQSFSKTELSSENLKVIKGETKWWEALKWSEVEWGKVGRPSKFDCIFCPVDIQADIMSQLEVDEDIDSILGRMVDESLQPSSGKVFKDKRKTHERRKPTATWTLEARSFEDGHSWRKYGQKVILNAKYPRNYFRCAHKYVQGCKAIKQVQRIQEEPALYNITYIGFHTCQGLALPKPEDPPLNSSTKLGFQNTLPSSTKDSLTFANNHSQLSKFNFDDIEPVLTWEEDRLSLEDGLSWRKYGQKFILNAKFPREYFRCTHKFDQGCQATKQVQRIQVEPALYRTIYRGHHTCTLLLKPEISTSNSSTVLGFQDTLPTQHDNTLFLSPSSPEIIGGRDSPSSTDVYNQLSADITIFDPFEF